MKLCVDNGVLSNAKAKPFLRWAGGKRALLPTLAKLLPEDVKTRRYVEPFLGGGALLFYLRPERALVADINEDLIITYRMIKTRPSEVVEVLNSLKEKHSKEFYYRVRDYYNTETLTDAIRAAYFIYLNKTCFNGLYRVNRLGQFNVPFGNRKNVDIDEATIRRASNVLKSVEIYHSTVVQTLSLVNKNDFVYLDPPYAVGDTSKFTQYDSSGFTDQHHTSLRDILFYLDLEGVKFMMTNSDTPFVRDLYKDFNQTVGTSMRVIGGRSSTRSTVNDLIITNY